MAQSGGNIPGRGPIEPAFSKLHTLLEECSSNSSTPDIVPLCAELTFSDFLTPSATYLKITGTPKFKGQESFLFESAESEKLGTYSFVGVGPRKILKTGPGHGEEIDPLPALEKELSEFKVLQVPDRKLPLPPLTGGAIGYVGYDCVRYFEPKTARPMKDVLKVPESLFMLFDTIIALNRFLNTVTVITNLRIPHQLASLEAEFNKAVAEIDEIIQVLESPQIPIPEQAPIILGLQAKSNIGEEGYKAHVNTLSKHIKTGDIIQAVPSQRFTRPTSLHPFNIYRSLRNVSPSPYLFYIDCGAFQIVGASPELLVKEKAGRIITHPIAGTILRSSDHQLDEKLADELRESLKDRAEHVMLVDLARNDINRVCDPLTTRVDKLMEVQKFSHVQHLVSEVSGVLRPGKTRFDAFRSIFPAGTVSGAPKIRAMELIAELEKEKRGIYAGAVGYFGYPGVDTKGVVYEGPMDTCIALRTMLVKDGNAYLQAGGGIVFDSEPQAEYEETINKLKGSTVCIKNAEAHHARLQGQVFQGTIGNAVDAGRVEGAAKVDLAAG